MHKLQDTSLLGTSSFDEMESCHDSNSNMGNEPIVKIPSRSDTDLINVISKSHGECNDENEISHTVLIDHIERPASPPPGVITIHKKNLRHTYHVTGPTTAEFQNKIANLEMELATILELGTGRAGAFKELYRRVCHPGNNEKYSPKEANWAKSALETMIPKLRKLQKDDLRNCLHKNIYNHIIYADLCLKTLLDNIILALGKLALQEPSLSKGVAEVSV